MPSSTRVWSSTTATRMAPSRFGWLPTAVPFCEPTAPCSGHGGPTLMSSGDEAQQLCTDNVFFDEESVVAELRVDDHRFVAVDVVGEVLGDLGLALNREQPVAVDPDDQACGRDPAQGLRHPASVTTDVVRVHRVHQRHVAVGVESAAELVAVKVEVTLDGELASAAERVDQIGRAHV